MRNEVWFESEKQNNCKDRHGNALPDLGHNNVDHIRQQLGANQHEGAGVTPAIPPSRFFHPIKKGVFGPYLARVQESSFLPALISLWGSCSLPRTSEIRTQTLRGIGGTQESQ